MGKLPAKKSSNFNRRHPHHFNHLFIERSQYNVTAQKKMTFTKKMEVYGRIGELAAINKIFDLLCNISCHVFFKTTQAPWRCGNGCFFP